MANTRFKVNEEEREIYFLSKQTLLIQDPSIITGKEAFEAAQQWLLNATVVPFDTETNGLDPHASKVLLAQFGDASYQFVVDCTTVDLKELMLDSWLDPNVQYIIHNAKFDYQMIKSNYGVDIVNIWDTMLAEQVIWCGLEFKNNKMYKGYSLDELVNHYFGVRLDKSVRMEFVNKDITKAITFTTSQIRYSADDVIYLEEIKNKQETLASSYEISMMPTINLENEAVRCYGDMEFNGIWVDEHYWRKEVIPGFISLLNTCTEYLDKLVIDEQNKEDYQDSDAENKEIDKAELKNLQEQYLKLTPEEIVEKSYIESQISLLDNKIKSYKTYEIKSQALDLWGNPTRHLVGKRKKKPLNTFLTTINWASSQQVVNVMENVFKISTEYFDKKEQSTKRGANKEVLEANISETVNGLIKERNYQGALEESISIYNENIEPISAVFCNFLLIFKACQKLTTSYGEKFLNRINKYTGRVHMSVSQIKETGRIGGDLQQMPAMPLFRKGFKATKNGYIISSDYSQAELRIIADHANEEAMVKAFLDDIDVHSYLATIAFNKPVSNKENKHLRSQIKTINFGLAYGAGPAKFASMFDNDVNKAKDFLNNKYYKSFPKLKQYFTNQQALGKAQGFSLTLPPIQRYRWYEEWSYHKDILQMNPKDSESLYFMSKVARKAGNHPIQGTCADIVKYSVVKLKQWIESKPIINGYEINPNNLKFILQVHDENVYELLIDDKELAIAVGKEIARIMEDCSKLWLKRLTLKSDPEVDRFWVK